MDNYIMVSGNKIMLTEDQTKKIMEDYEIKQKHLSDYAVGRTVMIGKFKFVVLDQQEGQTALVLKGMYGEETEFSRENNSYSGSYVDERCNTFARELSEVIGLENIVEHTVDLTSDDGMKDYGAVERHASLLTTDMYRKYVEILDTCKPGCWWWLATPHSTERHGNDRWIKCVAPSGNIDGSVYFNVNGVRPFCILKSNIFVSG